MEKIFHAAHLPIGDSQLDAGEVFLKRQHLCLSAAVAANAFGEGERQVYAVYYANLKMLLMAPMSDSLFKQAHDCSMLLLKDRDAKGGKSLALQEIIIDNDLDDSDRALPFNSAPGLRMLQVML